MNKHSRQILPIFLLLFLILWVGPAYSLIISGTEENVKSRSFRIGGTRYVPLLSACRAFGVDWDWDPISRKITLSKNRSSLVLLVGSNTYSIDGKIGRFKGKIEFSKGIILVPKTFIYGDWWIEVPEAKRTVRHRINVVVIDPGHGGKDSGAVGRGGLKEKDVVLSVSKYLREFLQGHGVGAILVRSGDRFVPLGSRANFANKNNADFFISIHANSYRDRRPKGFEVYYLSAATSDYAKGVAARENAVLKMENGLVDSIDSGDPTVWDLKATENRRESIGLANSIIEAMSRNVSARNRGRKSAGFYVLKKVDGPAVLVEMGFISNPSEEAKLKTRSYQKKLAQAICEGIVDYKTLHDETNGFTAD